ncbi:hypothetical protein [Alkalicoccobacillus murimartini]|uniref:Membrane protein n=1 Tax=Alkalicoccobacillus murimartini TaxID=171685 RepID=A0ABT9YKK7_9BACI|nr:hypothetical protein [Alkalicoccobacillus murimartini]MDQ0208402.1 putative membrane protein [Alkalicoccobacillus murimartini]
MESTYILAIVVMSLFVLIACFQLTLALGFPLGEFAMGGFHKTLPKKLRLISLFNAAMLLFIGLVFLVHTNVISSFSFIPTTLLVWFFTVFLGLNTLANLVSRSKKERLVMTPLSGLLCILCLLIALS